jgi:hypothetical protein
MLLAQHSPADISVFFFFFFFFESWSIPDTMLAFHLILCQSYKEGLSPHLTDDEALSLHMTFWKERYQPGCNHFLSSHFYRCWSITSQVWSQPNLFLTG